MDFFVDKKRLNMSAEQVMRKAGYAYFVDPKSHEESFVRRLYGDFYPRFHLYLEEDPDRIRFNLHLDQKKASYQGAHKHNAEYSGEAVEAEVIRLKQVITMLVQKG